MNEKEKERKKQIFSSELLKHTTLQTILQS